MSKYRCENRIKKKNAINFFNNQFKFYGIIIIITLESLCRYLYWVYQTLYIIEMKIYANLGKILKFHFFRLNSHDVGLLFFFD